MCFVQIVDNYMKETKEILKVVFNKTEQEAEAMSKNLLELEKKIGWVIKIVIFVVIR